jgi:phosphatidylglycerol:prolipoprotein diacylglycerol transferase
LKSFPYLSDVLNAIFGTDLWLPIPMFGLFVVLAISVACFAAISQVRWQEAQGALSPSTHRIVPDLALVSSIAGIIGARVFYIADHFGNFMLDPAAMIFTRSGFSVFGGLAFGFLAGVFYLRHRGIRILPTLDGVAPSLMLGYGIGRLGCQVAGDGDWGIPAEMALKPEWLPDWMWAQTYEGNILGAQIPAPGVYPTPLFEFAGAIFLFCVLVSLRSRNTNPGHLFSIYLLLAGFERLLIEKIRINLEHDFFGYFLTQAEVISLAVIGSGLLGVLLSLRTRRIWVKALISLGVLSAVSACAPC